MSFESQPFYEFGPFRLKPSERLLLRADQAIPLPPKAFDTLLLLEQNSGHVLSKDELMKSLWPNTFVEENNLTQNISQLRRALGEASGSHEFIETVPRLGYRFVMPVEEVDGNGAEEVLLRLRTRTHIVLHEQVEEEASNADSSEPRAPKTGRSKSWTPSAAPAGPSATRRFALGSACGCRASPSQSEAGSRNRFFELGSDGRHHQSSGVCQPALRAASFLRGQVSQY